MNMPKETKGAAPEDVQAHAFRGGSDESQATEQRDSGEDVSAHIPARDTSGDDVEGHSYQRPRPDRGDDEDVDAHFRRI